MQGKDKRSKRKLVNSNSHFSILKKSPTAMAASGLFRSPNSHHHRSPPNLMRRSQGFEPQSHHH